MPQDFEYVVFTYVADAIGALRGESGVYALSLFAWSEESDPLQPAINVGYNTRAQLAAAQAEAGSRQPRDPFGQFSGRPTDADEAKWNPAHWKDQWFRELRLDGAAPPPDLSDARRQWLRTIDARTEDGITAAFAELLVRVVRRLHAEDRLRRTFGKLIPVLILDEDHSKIFVEATRAANPPGIADEYCAHVLALWAT